MSRRSEEKKVEELYALIEDIEIAMMTTRRTDGRLVSRPMATQKKIDETDLWFMTNIESHKLDELENDPHVNLGYYDQKSREWVSVSGIATIVTDRAKIHELYEPDWKAWLGKEDEERDGGPDDPRIALLFVDADSVTYMKNTKPRPVILFQVAKALATGQKAEIGEVREVSGAEL